LKFLFQKLLNLKVRIFPIFHRVRCMELVILI